MGRQSKRPAREPDRERNGRARRLIAGLRVSAQEEALLDVVRPFLSDGASESELAYRLWRHGLELTLAEAVSFGARLPAHTTEQLVAGLVARRLMLALPLLRRTGTLSLLGLDMAAPGPEVLQHAPVCVPPEGLDTIDEGASGAITSLGGSDFL